MKRDLVRAIREVCLPHYDGATHGFDHAQRVAIMCGRLAEHEGQDPQLAEACGYLHDIARQRERRGEVACHAQGGAEWARDLLGGMGVGEGDVELIASAILTHRVSNGLQPDGWLGAILQDADRLDALGAIAIARVFARAGKDRSPLHDETKVPKKFYDGESTTAINHFFEKILRLTPSTFHTEAAREIAVARHAFVEGFVERFLSEWGATP